METFSASKILLHTKSTLDHLCVLEETTSTNDTVFDVVQASDSNVSVALARYQSKGRGRQGKVWESPKGGIYLSLALKPKLAQKYWPALSYACVLAVLEVLSSYSDKLRIKWPNDLVFNDCGEIKKVSGILLESHRKFGQALLICGVGINLEAQSFRQNNPNALAPISLEEISEHPRYDDVNVLVARLIDTLVSYIDKQSFSEEEFSSLYHKYNTYLIWKDEAVVLRNNVGEEVASGLLRGLNSSGALELYDGKQTLQIHAGTLSLRKKG
ncbi:MAG: biotin--[acetyl-CoA-carboxylase] ligase [Coriobacteriia bacterium]|nr:biotin--[acetyl-CoA-carboxylase] ligase [Coriobacteriia bacterium]